MKSSSSIMRRSVERSCSVRPMGAQQCSRQKEKDAWGRARTSMPFGARSFKTGRPRCFQPGKWHEGISGKGWWTLHFDPPRDPSDPDGYLQNDPHTLCSHLSTARLPRTDAGTGAQQPHSHTETDKMRRPFLQPSTGRHAPLHAPTLWWVSQSPLLHCCVAADADHENCVKGARREAGVGGARRAAVAYILHFPPLVPTTTPPPAIGRRARALLPPQAGVVQRVWRMLSTTPLHVCEARAPTPAGTASAHGRPHPFSQPVRGRLPHTPPPRAYARHHRSRTGSRH